MDVLYKCFLEGVGDKEPVFCQQHLHTAQTRPVLQDIFFGFRFNCIIECFRDYFVLKSADNCGEYVSKYLNILLRVFCIAYI